MKKSKKILLTAFLCFFLITFGFSFVWAQNGEPNVKDPVKRLEGIGAAAGFPQGSPTVAETIGCIIKTFISILGVIFMAYIVYAGYLWIIARGEEEKISKAKAIIRGSIIGLIVVLGAYAITAFVVSRFTTSAGYTPLIETADDEAG